MSEDILGVLEPLDHLEIRRFHRAAQRIALALSPLIDVHYKLRLRAEKDLSMILEVDLNDLV
jgi:hypothetical protein